MATVRLRETVTENPYIPSAGGLFPSEPQALFLTLPVEEAMYGGAAGGGKSSALLAGALQDVDHPRYAALLLRRTFADLKLPGALMDRAQEWLGSTDARWNDNDHQWVFPSGATLTFGYLENERDKFRYQSSEFQYVGFDELTQFTETQYTYLMSRLRRLSGMNIPLRIRSATNPGGVGHEWVKQRFIAEGEDRGRFFVPAVLEDNPGLDRVSYRRQLDKLDPVTRAQLRNGDWEVRPEGNLFKLEWFANRYTDHPGEAVRRVRFWDLAATEPSTDNPDPDYTAGVLMAQDDSGGFVIDDAQEFRRSPADVEARVKATANSDGRDVEIFIEQEPGASGKSMIDHYARSVLAGFSVTGVRATGDKITRAKPFSAACQNGLVRLVRAAWNGLLLNRLTGFGLPGVHDDMTDAASGAHRALTGGYDDFDAADWHQVLNYEQQGDRMSAKEKLIQRIKGR